MKSIMEEASSIFKAIEKGWTRAGKPIEFSVKVYEEAHHNFLGMTTKPAKIGIFFNDSAVKTKQAEKAVTPKPEKSKTLKSPKTAKAEQQGQKHDKKIKKQQLQPSKTVAEAPSQPQTSAKKEQPWSQEMIVTAKDYLNDTLKILNLNNKYTVDSSHLYLKFIFNEPLYADLNRQKQFFASLATLIIQMLKKRFKRPLKGYKIILQTENT